MSVVEPEDVPEKQRKWDARFLRIAAREVSTWSKDPSTKCGAIITSNNRIVSTGYNGFPSRIADTPERLGDRETKYKLIIHAEINALHEAREDTTGHTVYTYPLPPCHRCALDIIQRGISRIVAIEASDEIKARWKESNELSMSLFEEAGIEVTIYDKSIIEDSH